MGRLFEAPGPNHLNSVWLEGTMVAEPAPEAGPPGTDCCRFHLQGGPSIFLVEATMNALDGCRERLQPGRQLRIIGRLHQERRKGPDGNRSSVVKVVGELVEPVGGPV